MLGALALDAVDMTAAVVVAAVVSLSMWLEMLTNMTVVTVDMTAEAVAAVVRAPGAGPPLTWVMVLRRRLPLKRSQRFVVDDAVLVKDSFRFFVRHHL